MSNRARVAVAALTEPWAVFLAEVFPDGIPATSKRAGRKPGTDISERSRWMNLRVRQPNAVNTWKLAHRARTVRAANAWCAGSLFLYAAGHFDEFARVMLCANVDDERKIQLLENVASACCPTISPLPRAQRKAALIAEGYDELEVQAVLDEEPAINRPDRAIWTMRDRELAAFTRAFKRGVEIPAGRLSIAGFTCEAVVRCAQHGIEPQKAAIFEALRHAFGR